MPKKPRTLKQAQSLAAISAREGEKRDFHSTEVFSDGDFAGEISAQVFKSVSETVNDDNDFLEKLDLSMIGVLLGLYKNECESRKVTALLYMILRYLGHQWRAIDDIFRQISTNRRETAHK